MIGVAGRYGTGSVLGKALFEVIGMSCVVAAIDAMEDINPKWHLFYGGLLDI